MKHKIKNTWPLNTVLPQWFEIDAEVALPESVPIKYLAEGVKSWRTTAT